MYLIQCYKEKRPTDHELLMNKFQQFIAWYADLRHSWWITSVALHTFVCVSISQNTTEQQREELFFFPTGENHRGTAYQYVEQELVWFLFCNIFWWCHGIFTSHWRKPFIIYYFTYNGHPVRFIFHLKT